MPLVASTTFEPGTAKLDPIYPNSGARCHNGAMLSGPPVAPAPVVASGIAGTPSGTYRCSVTFVTAAGETSNGVEATVTVASQHIAWSAIPLGPAGTTARKLYRTAPGGATGTGRLATTLADNTTTVFDDNLSDATIAGGVLVPSVSTAGVAANYARGLVVGELTTMPGTFKAYASGNTDGSQVAKGILQYACSVDVNGNVTLAGEFGQQQRGVPIYFGGGGVFDTTQLVGLDANAVANLGGSLVQGTLAAGQFRF